MADTAACPSCQAKLVAHVALPWGDGAQRLPAAPWICSHCAALGIIELETGMITLVPDDAWKPVQERNPVLWQDIVQARALILAQGGPHDA
jgi:hypothetical protein